LDSSVTFVLVGVQSPGNLGAVCRLAKAVGFPDVRVVRPEADLAADEARWLAHNAEDVLQAVRRFDSLPAALKGCFRSVASTARPRNWNRPVRRPEEMATTVAAAVSAGEAPWAVVFGPEDRGLSNEDLAECDEIVSIPMPRLAKATLSLPMAASILAWELAQATEQVTKRPAARGDRSERSARLLGTQEVEELMDHIRGALTELDFRPHPNELMFRGSLRDFLARARPTIGDRLVLTRVFAAVGKWKRRVRGEAARGELG